MANKGSSRKVKCIETGIIYDSIKEAAKAVGLKAHCAISDCCNGKQRTAGGYHWEYTNEFNKLPNEIWKDAIHLQYGTDKYEMIPGYSVSNFGRFVNNETGHILKTFNDTDDYTNITLNKKRYRAHRIVASTFIPNDDPLNKTEVNHIKENEKSNNRVDNLEWCTQTENNNYGTRTKRATETIKNKYGAEIIKNAIDANKKKVQCVETEELYDSLTTAAESAGLKSYTSISDVIDNPNRTAGGYHWVSVNDRE